MSDKSEALEALAWICDKASDIADGYEVFEREGIIRASLEQKAEPVSCALCGGTGYDPECDVQAVCCGNVDRRGECCSNPIQEQVALPCRQCDGFGRIYTTPLSTAEVEARALDSVIEAFESMVNESDNHELCKAILEAKRIREQSND